MCFTGEPQTWRGSRSSSLCNRLISCAYSVTGNCIYYEFCSARVSCYGRTHRLRGINNAAHTGSRVKHHPWLKKHFSQQTKRIKRNKSARSCARHCGRQDEWRNVEWWLSAKLFTASSFTRSRLSPTCGGNPSCCTNHIVMRPWTRSIRMFVEYAPRWPKVPESAVNQPRPYPSRPSMLSTLLRSAAEIPFRVIS